MMTWVWLAALPHIPSDTVHFWLVYSCNDHIEPVMRGLLEVSEKVMGRCPPRASSAVKRRVVGHYHNFTVVLAGKIEKHTGGFCVPFTSKVRMGVTLGLPRFNTPWNSQSHSNCTLLAEFGDKAIGNGCESLLWKFGSKKTFQFTVGTANVTHFGTTLYS